METPALPWGGSEGMEGGGEGGTRHLPAPPQPPAIAPAAMRVPALERGGVGVALPFRPERWRAG